MSGEAREAATRTRPDHRDHDPGALRRLGPVPALDGVRGIAVLLVMMVHLQLLLPFEQTGIAAVDGFIRGGYLGVDLFFVLSGFLITSLLLGEAAHAGWVRYGAFYARRALRLLPALYVLLAAHVVYAVVTDLSAANEVATVRAALLYISNWQVVVDPSSVAQELTHLWSLAIEEQFYLWWPALLVLFLGPLRRARTVTLVLTGAILAVVVWRAWLLDHGVYWTELTVRTDTRLDALLIGALLGSLWVRRATPTRGVDGAAWVALVVLLGAVAVLRGPDDLGYQGGLTVFALAAAVLVLALVNGTWGGRWIFELAPLVAVGKVSYGLYLWHYPIFYAVGVHGQDLDELSRVALALTLTTVATLASWHLVERPALGLKARFGGAGAGDPQRPPPPPPARVPLPGWQTESGRTLWGGLAAVVLLAAAALALGSDHGRGDTGGPDGLAFPAGDTDRIEYWGLVGMEATLVENFDRPDDPASLTVADTGQTWAVASGTWAVDDGAGTVSEVPGPEPAIAVLTQADRDGLTEVTLTDVRPGAGLVVRYEDPGNFWAVVARPEDGGWEVRQWVDGAASAIGDFEAPTADGTTVSVTQDETTIRVLVEGVEELRAQDVPVEPPYQSGLIGSGPESEGARWDRYLVLRFDPTGAAG